MRNKPEWLKKVEWDGHRISGPRHVSVLALLRFLHLLGVIKKQDVAMWGMVDVARKYARRHYK